MICVAEVKVGVKVGSSGRVHLSGNAEERSHIHEFKILSSSSWKYDDTMNRNKEIMRKGDERVEL